MGVPNRRVIVPSPAAETALIQQPKQETLSKKKQPDERPTFEDALTRLSDVVRALEEGNLTLGESLARYEEGIRHLSQCQKILSSAERKIEVLSGFDSEGNPVTQQFEDDDMTLQEKADSRSRRRTAKPTQAKRPAKTSSHSDVTCDQEADDVDLDGTLF